MQGIRIFPRRGLPRRGLTRRARHASAAMLVAGVIAACGGGTSAPTASGATARGGAGGATVNLKNLKFTPKKLEIKVGQTVTWVWREKVAHNVVFRDKVKSKLTNKGPYTRTFEKAGKYPYTCSIHPGMDGEIIVK